MRSTTGLSKSRNPQFLELYFFSALKYRVIQEETAILWEMIVCVILSKKAHINMCPILDGYGDMGIY